MRNNNFLRMLRLTSSIAGRDAVIGASANPFSGQRFLALFEPILILSLPIL